MTHTALAVQTLTDDGVVPSYSAAPAGGTELPGDGDTVLHVKNGSGVSINVTVQTGGTLEGEPVADKVVAVAAGAEKFIGPFRPAAYNQPVGAASHANKVIVDYSAVTTVTIAAFKLG